MKKLFTFCFINLCAFLFCLAKNSTTNCGPIPPVCTPGRVHPIPQGGLGMGITHLQLAQINRTFSNNDTSGYKDYSCSDSTLLIQGNIYQFTATTGQTYEECIRVWMDYNNDGAFDTTELIFADSAIVYSHSGYVTIPQTGILNTPLQLRVASDYSIPPPVNACLPVQWGHYKDFTVYLDGPDAISEPEEKYALEVFPNPFKDRAQIILNRMSNENGNRSIKIYNSTGALVRQEELKNESSIFIFRNGLKSGFYFFCLYTEDNLTGTGKFIIE